MRNTCRKCGREIAVIEFGVYRKAVVDPEVVWVAADPLGEEFVRFDGSKVRGNEADMGTIGAEAAYRLRRKTCGGRKA